MTNVLLAFGGVLLIFGAGAVFVWFGMDAIREGERDAKKQAERR